MAEEKKAASQELVDLDGKEGQSALEAANDYERRVQLEGPQDPDKFKLADGRSLTEHRQSFRDGQEEEGRKEDEVQSARIREQSIEGDPLYAEGSKAVAVGGNAVVIPGENPTQSPEKELPPPTTPAKIDPDTLPADFPVRSELITAGFDTLTKVREADDQHLLAVTGVGDAVLGRIRAAQVSK